MTGTLVTASYPNGLVLSNPTLTDVSIAGTVVLGNTAGPALYAGGTINPTITNSGTAAATGTIAASYGILLAGSGTVTNTTGGLVSGIYSGVLMHGVGTVVNQGSIAEKSTAKGAGVLLNAGGGVTNGSVITGVNDGVLIGAAGQVNNTGSIDGAANNGIFISGAGGVVNGTLSTISGYRMGISVRGAGTVINQGDIISRQTSGTGAGYNTASHSVIFYNAGVLLSSGGIDNATGATISGYFFGVAMYGNGSVSNAGSISGQKIVGVELLSGGYVGNSGSLNGAFAAARAGQVATIDNQGVMTSTTLGAGGVAFLQRGGTIINEASASLSGHWKGAAIYANASGSAPGTILNEGLILAADQYGDGAGAWMKGAGLISNGSAGTISGGGFGVVTYNFADTVVNNGTIFGTEFAVDMGAGGTNRLIAYPGAVFSGTVTGGNALTSTIASVLELAPGSGVGSIVGLGSKYVDFAQVALDSGASWSLAGTVVAGETLRFAGAGAMTLANPGSVAGTIEGFGGGDTIALAGVADAISATLGTGNVLTVARSGGPAITLQFDPTQSFLGTSFPFTIAGGNTDLSAPVLPCFTAGTRILTPAGEMPVEMLGAGDRVILARGGTAPIIWIGRRRIDCRAHAAQRAVLPVCIRAGAIAPGTPARDLWLSPDHAVYVDGVLIPVRWLINGRSIVQLAVDAVTYLHVELPRHDVIVAEGLRAESYLDTGNRAAFAERPRERAAWRGFSA